MQYPVNTNGTIGLRAPPSMPPTSPTRTRTGWRSTAPAISTSSGCHERDIIVANPRAGTTIGHITGIPGGGQLTNLAFGGNDHKTLYITVMGNSPAKGVFKLPMSIPGMPY